MLITKKRNTIVLLSFKVVKGRYGMGCRRNNGNYLFVLCRNASAGHFRITR